MKKFLRKVAKKIDQSFEQWLDGELEEIELLYNEQMSRAEMSLFAIKTHLKRDFEL